MVFSEQLRLLLFADDCKRRTSALALSLYSSTVGFETDAWSWPNHPAETTGQGRAGGQHDVKLLISIL